MTPIELRRGEPGAPEITFLHGFLGAPEQFAAIATDLPAHVRVSALVLPGHGASPDVDAASFSEACSAINAAFSAPRRRILVGYSLGGRLALGAAVDAPAQWNAVVAIGAHGGIADWDLRAEKRREDLDRAAMVRTQGIERFVEAWEREPLFATQASLDAGALSTQRELRLRHTREGIAWSLEHLGSGAMPVLDLEKVRARVVLVAGERDTRFVATAERIAKEQRWAKPRIVAGAGHNVILEAPAAILEILNRQLEESGT